MFYKPLEKARDPLRSSSAGQDVWTSRLHEREHHPGALPTRPWTRSPTRGFDPVYGARPLKRYMQSHLETMLARKAIVAGDVLPGQTVRVDVDADGELEARNKSSRQKAKRRWNFAVPTPFCCGDFW